MLQVYYPIVRVGLRFPRMVNSDTVNGSLKSITHVTPWYVCLDNGTYTY